jgi:site-specific recombinase XerD
MGEPDDHEDKTLGPANVLQEAEIRALLAAFPRRGLTATRNRALVLLLWRAGLRIAEAVHLEVRDLALDGPEPNLTVRNGKGGKQRVVGIHQEAVQALEHWLKVRAELGLARYKTIFCTLSSNHRGEPVDPGYVRQMLKRKAAQAGLGTRVHPHAFRATLAVELAREGVPLPAIREVLGHANVSTTDSYLRRVFPQDAIDAVINRAADREPEPEPSSPRQRLTEHLGADNIALLDDAQVEHLLEVLEPPLEHPSRPLTPTPRSDTMETVTGAKRRKRVYQAH